MPEGNYIIQNDESRVKQSLFQNKFNNPVKKTYQVTDPKTGETRVVETEQAVSIILEDLRKGAHTPQVEEYIRTAIVNAQQRRSHNLLRMSMASRRLEEWAKLSPTQQLEILERNPNYINRLQNMQVDDTYVDLCLSTAYTISNLSVSSSANGNKPLVHRYLEPYTKEEHITRQAPLPDEKPKKNFGGFF